MTDALHSTGGPQEERRNFGDDPVAYYRAHYDGLTRGELRQRDRSLYQVLWKSGLLTIGSVGALVLAGLASPAVADGGDGHGGHHGNMVTVTDR